MNIINGFLITTERNKENKASKEIKEKINEILKINICKNKLKNSDNLNYKEILQREIKELKESKIKQIDFKNLKNIILFKNLTEVSVYEIYKIMKEKNFNFKFAHRIIPLEYFGNYKEIIEILKLECNKIELNELTYKLVLEARLTESNKKEEIFSNVVNNIKNKVNLTNPDFIVMVQILKSNLGFSIIKNYNDNFNFHN